ncbi:hypothetical protein [Streptomyces uncialis]|uniref:DUF4760 domain-containing protein n=1 Tax=Streptomyces uncialis TaxID=1048205 RepID=A0A1Q4V129_9ACTN|nr:hypothetical protein [Streptomyces uncialis]OKH91521.1 hypothetical protein AB852_28615 [Streptomyces uncialis]
MPNWLTTVMIAAVTATVAATLTGLLAAPRLEARNRRLQALQLERELFGAATLKIWMYASRLRKLTPPDGSRSSLEGDRSRWLAEIDAASRTLVDCIAPLTYIGPIGRLALRYALSLRGVWLSGRSDAAKLELVAEMAAAAQKIYFTAAWQRPRRTRHAVALERLCDDLVEGRR